MKLTAFERITKMLEIAHLRDERVFSPTVLYKEGWMLRIILRVLHEGLEYPPLTFQDGARWFSEAQLKAPFHPREGEAKRNKELGRPNRAEGPTNADGVFGHFDTPDDTKVGFKLREDATQFVVIEAKMYSELRADVTNDPDYDQAARTVASMSWAIAQSGRSVSELTSLGFYVVAPQEQLETKKTFSSFVNKESIGKKVENRVNDYVDREEIYEELLPWYDDTFVPTLEHIDIDCISWEDLIDRIDDDSIHDFYKRCRRFNKKGK